MRVQWRSSSTVLVRIETLIDAKKDRGNMNKALRLTLVVCMGLLLCLGTVPVLAEDLGAPLPPPGPPPTVGCHMFYGDVSVGGNPAYDGTVVAAHIGGLSWETTTTGGSYGYPEFYVPPDNPGTPAKDGGVNGDLVTFTVSGMNVTASYIFHEDYMTKLDLNLVGMVAQISGVTCAVNCTVLGGVDVELFVAGGDTVITGTTSDGSGNYVLPVAAAGTYDVVASKSGFRDETQDGVAIIAGVNTLNFRGDTGIIPNAPDVFYVLDCVNNWLYPADSCGLSVFKVLEVVNAWLYPVTT